MPDLHIVFMTVMLNQISTATMLNLELRIFSIAFLIQLYQSTYSKWINT